MPEKGRRGWRTAAEVMAELEANPEYVAQRERQEQERQRKEVEFRKAEVPLVRELREAGFEVNSAWDLVNTSRPYPGALRILLEHLERPYPDRVREGIARALAVRDAKFGWERLTRLYREERAGTDAKSGLAAALAAISDRKVIDELTSLAADPVHGQSRILLLRGLARLRTPQAREALERFTADPMLGEEARRILSRRKR